MTYPLLMAVSLLPYPLLYALSDVLSFLLYRIFKFRLKVVRKNLKLSLPHLSENELLKVERKFYKHFCDVFMEILAGMNYGEGSRNQYVLKLDKKNTHMNRINNKWQHNFQF